MVQRIVEELKCRGYNVWFGKSRATLIGLRQLFLRWLISTDIETIGVSPRGGISPDSAATMFCMLSPSVPA